MLNSTQSMAIIPYTPYKSGIEFINSQIEKNACVESKQKFSYSLSTMAVVSKIGMNFLKSQAKKYAHEILLTMFPHREPTVNYKYFLEFLKRPYAKVPTYSKFDKKGCIEIYLGINEKIELVAHERFTEIGRETYYRRFS